MTLPIKDRENLPISEVKGNKEKWPSGTPGFNIIGHPLQTPRNYLFDADMTLYDNADYAEHTIGAEWRGIAEVLGWSVEETPRLFSEVRSELSEQLGRPARMTDTVKHLGMSMEDWVALRERHYRPEDFDFSVSQMPEALMKILADGNRIAILSNSPSTIVTRVLGRTGIPLDVLAQIQVIGPDVLAGAHKPTVEYYTYATQLLGIGPTEAIMIGDDRQNDISPALQAGMGAIHVENAHGTVQAIEHMINPQGSIDPFYEKHPVYSRVTPGDIASSVYEPGKIKVVGVVGRAGTGKSTTTRAICEGIQQSGKSEILQLDAFFYMSRKERKQWLNEPGISEAERERRGKLINWWDFDLAAETLARVKAGEHIHMEGVYDMEQGGEKVGVIDITPDPSGHVILLDGAAILQPALLGQCDELIYVHTHNAIRANALMQRNLQGGYSPEESVARKQLTDLSESTDYLSHEHRVRAYSGRNLIVLDNSARCDTLGVLPPFIPEL